MRFTASSLVAAILGSALVSLLIFAMVAAVFD
jgi:hypothetical protein